MDMQNLTPVGLTKDGSHLVLISSRGVEFAVKVDQALRDALRGDQSRLGQLEMKMESTLRPRDIQARIRSGESAEEVAAAANTSVDKIMIYAGPVLAERAHIARSALLASIRRKNADSSVSARTLSDATPPYFREVGMRPDDVEWDAWRRDDGRWTLVATFQADGKPQHAEFTYDAPGRYVVADNEAGRRLTGESRPPQARPSSGRRLSAVPSEEGSQAELPLGSGALGDDALEMVREHDTDEALTADHADADWIAPAAPSDDEVTEEISLHDSGPARRSAPHETTVSESPWLDARPQKSAPAEPARESASEDVPPDSTREESPDGADPESGSEPASTSAEAPDAPAAEQKPAPKPKKRGRAQVPSWDEIMFGGGGGKAE